MKNLLLLTGICFLMIVVSLFLPYEIHDLYSGGFFSSSTLYKANQQLAGLEIEGAYVPLLSIIVISLVVLLKKNLATGIIGFILGFVLLLYMGVFAFGLTFSLNFGGGPENQRLSVGYYMALFAVISYLVLLLINMVVVSRNRKSNNKQVMPPDLLDDLLN